MLDAGDLATGAPIINAMQEMTVKRMTTRGRQATFVFRSTFEGEQEKPYQVPLAVRRSLAKSLQRARSTIQARIKDEVSCQVAELGRLSECVAASSLFFVILFEWGLSFKVPCVLQGFSAEEKVGALSCFTVVAATFCAVLAINHAVQRRNASVEALERRQKHDAVRRRLWQDHKDYILCSVIFCTTICLHQVAAQRRYSEPG